MCDGFAERGMYSDLFPRGLTVLDQLAEIMPFSEPPACRISAAQEAKALLEALRVPIDERGWRRTAARAEWFASRDKPLEMLDVFAE